MDSTQSLSPLCRHLGKIKRPLFLVAFRNSLILMVPRPLSNHHHKVLILNGLTIYHLKHTPKNTPNLVAMLRYDKTQKTTISPTELPQTSNIPAKNFGTPAGNELAKSFARFAQLTEDFPFHS